MNDPALVILAGGLSSRMKRSAAAAGSAWHRETGRTPKTLIEVGQGNTPFLDYLLCNAERAGYRDIVLVVGEENRAFRRRYGEADRGNRFHELEISYAVQSIPPGRTKPLGTADALLQALRARPDWAGHACTVCNSDNLYSVASLGQMLEAGNSCAMMDYDRDALGLPPGRAALFAVLIKDADGRLVDIAEKPSPAEMERAAGPDGRVGVSMNIFRFSCDVIRPFLEAVPLHPIRHEKELPVAVTMMIRALPGVLKVYPVAEAVPDLTSVQDIDVVDGLLRKEFRTPPWH